MLTRTGRRLLEEDPEGAARAIAAADQELKEHADLSKDKAQVLKDCWVQKTDMDSAARKLGMKRGDRADVVLSLCHDGNAAGDSGMQGILIW